MARTRNASVHAVRRDAFVDAAQRLIQAKGYEQMSIQDVLDEVDASRGAFYHYFGSKADLLEAVVERLTEAATAALLPIVEDPALSATSKLDSFFTGLARWKGERTDLLRGLMDTWLADDNAIVREKLRRGTVVRLTPILGRIVAQGRDEGWPATGEPEHVARVLVSIIQGANEAATELYFARRDDAIPYAEVEPRLAAYWRAMERTLGLPTRSFSEIDRATLREWYG
jgi:AcrR family transcriptional regulator